MLKSLGIATAEGPAEPTSGAMNTKGLFAGRSNGRNGKVNKQFQRGSNQRYKKNFLINNKSKSEFHIHDINFLGYILGEGTLRMEPGNVDTIQNWETPTYKERGTSLPQFYKLLSTVYTGLRPSSETINRINKRSKDSEAIYPVFIETCPTRSLR